MMITALLVSVGVGTYAFVDGPDKAPPVVIVGTVVDAGRQPAAGAGVSFSIRDAGTFWGGVVAQTETDRQGRFRLEVPGAPGGGPEPGILWAYRPGSLVAARRILRETLPPDWPVAMVLDEPARAVFLVRGPDGRPVAGARIQPRVLDREFFAVPDGLAERIEAQTVTDDSGRAVLSAFFPEEIDTVIVAAPDLGRQQFGFSRGGDKHETKTIDLMPVGRLEGRIVAEETQLPRRPRLAVIANNAKTSPPSLGLTLLDADERGRFTVPEVPVGFLRVYAQPPAGSPWFLLSLWDAQVAAGKTTRVEVRAVKGVRLKGVVRERDTGRPIAGFALGLHGSYWDPDAMVRSDARGRFELFSLPGFRRIVMGPDPEGLAAPPVGAHSPKVPAGVAEFELKPIGMSPAGTVRGLVVDERGEPVPGAKVHAAWPASPGPLATGRMDRRAIAGARGEFLIAGAVRDVAVDLSATATDGRRTTRSVASRVGAEPARLVLEAAESVSMAGRVVDTSGHRVAGARVHLRTVRHLADGHVFGDELVEIRGAYVLRTGDNGWFRTPTILDPKLKYAALAEADGFEPARTGWVAGTARTFPELVLRPEAQDRPAVVDGSVTDRAGRPVAGAAVWTTNEAGTPIRSSTDARGRFRLEKIPPAPLVPVRRGRGVPLLRPGGRPRRRSGLRHADPVRRATVVDDVDPAAGPAEGRGAGPGEPAVPPLRRAGRQGRRPLDAIAVAGSPGPVRPRSRPRDHRDGDPRQPRSR